MEGETSWVSHCFRSVEKNIVYSQRSENVNKEAAAHSLDILPDDLIERILSNLPIVSIFRSGCVCKRWNEIVSSRRFVRNLSQTPRKPWYFMFTSSDEPFGYAFDPILKKWYSIELPYLETSNWFIASSCGLVCFMDNDSGSDSIDIYVCNPITHQCKLLQEPVGPGLKFSDYTTLAISVDRVLHNYAVSIVKSKQVPGNFFQWELGIHVFHSETMMWANPLNEVFMGWRGGDESIICDGVLYLLIYNIGGAPPEIRHGLVTYNLVSRSSHSLLMSSFIPAPCSLTCCRLMSLKDKLILVGGIGKQDRSDIIKGIGIWALKGKGWQEIARMPHKFFQGFGELDDVFASSGTDDIIYIQSYGAPSLLLFDMNQKQWRWAQKYPVAKKFPLQLFTGFCFEPRLEIMP